MKKIDNMLIGLFGAIILLCLIFICRDIFKYRKADKEYDGLKEYMETYPADIGAMDETIKASYMSKRMGYLDELKTINSDVVGVLSIPYLDISYPVVQGDQL